MLFGKTKAENEMLKVENEGLRKSLSEANTRADKAEKLAKAQVYATVRGLSAEDIKGYVVAVNKEYDKARNRQKSKDAAPSDYMKGLSAALKILDKFPLRDLI